MRGGALIAVGPVNQWNGSGTGRVPFVVPTQEGCWSLLPKIERVREGAKKQSTELLVCRLSPAGVHIREVINS